MGTRDYLANRTPVPRGNIPLLFFEAVERFGDGVAHQSIGPDEELRSLSFREVEEKVRVVGAGLRALGLGGGDRVAILAENRPEWSQTDYGALCVGMQVVPVHTNLTPPQIGFILQDSGCKAVFASSEEMVEKALEATEGWGARPLLVSFDPPAADLDGILSWAEFMHRGAEVEEEVPRERWKKEAVAQDPDDTATILYTSGTTGTPKGVMLTHNNLFSNAVATGLAVPILEEDTTLSFLPLSHSLQRMADYLFFSKGSTIAYARSIRTVPEDLRIVQPTKVVGAPRMYEKSYQKVMDQKGLSNLIVRWAREVGEAWADEKLAGRDPTWILKLVYRLAFALVFRRIHQGLGGRVSFFITGSAPLAPEINKFFYSAGVMILEGYGLSETSPVATANTPYDFQIGTVGPPIPGTEIRIAEDGEVLIRGPQVMKGYLNRPEDTRAALDEEGWLRSGDIGEIDERGHLRITDRKKNLLVTAGGKNVAPAPIENLVKGNRFVDQVVMIGDGRHFLSLLVVPTFDCLEDWAAGKGITFGDRYELLRDTRTQEHMGREVFECLGGLASYETPKKLGLIMEEFTIEGGILTPNLKVKRRVVQERYGRLIKDLYDPGNVARQVFVDEG